MMDAAETYLLGLVTQSACLVRTGRPGDTDNRWELTVLPAPHPLQEPHNI